MKKVKQVKKGMIKFLIIILLMIIASVSAYFGINKYNEIKKKKIEYQNKIEYYQQIANTEKNWISSNQVSNGVILFYKNKNGVSNVVPYFSNTAAISLLGNNYTSEDGLIVKNYISWYLSHINTKEQDSMNGAGSIFDYKITHDGFVVLEEESKGTYDSVDSYASTFISLLLKYYEKTGDYEYLTKNSTNIVIVINALLNVMDTDTGLSFTGYPKKIKYLMDNVEVNKGLSDAIFLIEVMQKENYYSEDIDSVELLQLEEMLKLTLKKNSQAIEELLWNHSEQRYEIGLNKDNIEFKFKGWEEFYADAVCQLFPITYGVIEPDSNRARILYDKFCETYQWEELEHFKMDRASFYWCVIAYTGAVMNDQDRVGQYLSLYEREIMVDHAYPLYIAEAGWYVKTCDKMIEIYQNKIKKIDPFGIVKTSDI